MIIKGGSEQSQGMFSRFGIQTVRGEGNIHMTSGERGREIQRR